ncbi:MAG: hypothetical protein D6717_03185 [Gammaproteobacteria bacterium]|nr:MAG: hypothetical protein D6717_03185 [Gammaproteobacteria bacterium]
MNDINQRLAAYGFDSNQDFRTPVRCLLATPPGEMRCLEVTGTPGRRKTAFAHALAQALGYPELRYHEFRDEPPRSEPVRIPEDRDSPPGAQPVDPLDQAMAEACALSEGERTVLILDQLQQAPFSEHLRLAEFLRTHLWRYGDLTLKANPANLMLMLISETPLFHGLRRHSFRIWVEPEARLPASELTPELLGLGNGGQPLLEALNRIFEQLEVQPTVTEYRRVVHAVHTLVHDLDDLLAAIYGWVEGVPRDRIDDPQIRAALQAEMGIIEQYLGLSTEEEGAIVLREDENH